MEDHTHRRNRLAINRWLSTQRGRPSYRPPPPLSRSVSKIVAPLTKTHGGAHHDLIKFWSDIVGEKLSKHSKPVKIGGSAKGRVLVISAPSAVGALIMASKDDVLSRACAYLGGTPIKAIKIEAARPMSAKTRIKPLEKPSRMGREDVEKLQSGLEKVADPDLKTALEKFGQAVLANEASRK